MHGFRVASIYRPDTGAVVQLNNLIADGCAYEEKPLEGGARAETSQGNAYDGGSSFELRLRALGATERATLQAWYDAEVPVRCVALAAAAGGFNVQWYESVRMQSFKEVAIKGKADGGRADAFDVVFYSNNPRAAVYRQANLVAHLGWADANADGTPDGYSVSGGSTGFTNDGTSTYATISQSSGDRSLYVDVELPIVGVTVTAGQYPRFVHSAGAVSTIEAAARSSAGTTLGSASSALVANTRSVASLVTPAGTYRVRLTPMHVVGGSGAGTTSAQEVSARVDASPAYLAY